MPGAAPAPGSGHGSVRDWDDRGTGTASPPVGCTGRQPARMSGREPGLSRPDHIISPSHPSSRSRSTPYSEGSLRRGSRHHRDGCRRLTGPGRARRGQAALSGGRSSVSPPGGYCHRCAAAERGAWPRPRSRPRYETRSMRVSFSKP